MGEGSRLSPARPKIRLDGREDGSLTAGLIRLRIQEDQSGLFACEATFGNWGPAGGRVGFLYFDRGHLEFGRPFAVTLDGATLFNGRITGLDACFPDGRSPEVTVLAEDRLQDLRMTRRTRSFAQMSDADVMRQIATEHGLTPDLDVTGPTHRILAQLNQSDLAFLRERARALDAELWIDDRTLGVKQHSRRNGGRVRFGYGNELTEFEVLADLAHQRSSVTVTGWDVAGKRGLAELADDAAVRGELGDGDSGANVLRTALAERKETVSHEVSLTADEAKARAEAMFRRRARRFVRGHGIAQTDPKLRVGATVQLDGLGPLFSGDYYVADATHRFDTEQGMRSDFTVERPGLGRPR
jgi:phage protein D